ncbi:MAG: hypothetical protein Fur002_03420 [Anaerolineales bacterium]
MQNRSWLPPADRVGMLVASLLLAFALTRLIQSPRLTLSIALPGFYFAYPLTLATGVTLLAAALSGAGMNWLAGEARAATPSAAHLALPTLTAFVLGSFLNLLPNGAAWWGGLAAAGLLLAGVFLAEYIAIEPASPLYGVARASLTALAYALFLMSAAALRFAGMRMFALAPSIFLVAGLISLRILLLDSSMRWNFAWAAGIGVVCMQIGGGLHYWNITPLQFGLALIGPFYGLTLFAEQLAENIPARRAAFAPAFIAGFAWAAAFFLR